MTDHQDIRTGYLALWGFVGTIVVLVLVFVMVVIYYHTTARLEYQRNISLPYAELETALQDQRIRLVEYEAGEILEVDGQQVTQYRIPIDEAMKIVLAEWESGTAPGPPRKLVSLTVEKPPAETAEPSDKPATESTKPAEKPAAAPIEKKKPAEKQKPAAPQEDAAEEGEDDA